MSPRPAVIALLAIALLAIAAIVIAMLSTAALQRPELPATSPVGFTELPRLAPAATATPGPGAFATTVAAVGTQLAVAQATALANPPVSVGHLLRTATGEVQRLWGERETGDGSFTKDSRWLTYTSGPDTNNLMVHLADLSVWPPVTLDFGPGIQPILSTDATLVAFSTGWYGDVVPQVVVKRVATQETLAAIPGRAFNWSPDGRWLAVYGPWLGEQQPVQVFVADTTAWGVRLLYQMLPCQCDSTYGPYWSSDGRWLAYGRKVESDAYLVDPDTLAATRLPGIPTGWVDAAHVEVATNGGRVSYDVNTGATAPLTKAGDAPGGFPSPDGSGIVRPAPRAFADPVAASLTAARPDGTALWTTTGTPLAWSADGSFFAIGKRPARPGQAPDVEIVRGLDGSVERLLPSASGLVWSPAGSALLYAVSQGRQGCVGPMGNHAVQVHLADMSSGAGRAITPAFELDCRSSAPPFIWAPDSRHVLLCTACGWP